MIRTLTHEDFDSLFAAFGAAFSDYVVKLSPTREQLLEMFTRRGWIPSLSVGAFDGNRMVAFTVNGVDGDRAYDSGTGVVPTHRRHGLARQLMEKSFELLRPADYVLEVLDNNPKAIALYRDLGFKEKRGLQCWTFDASSRSDARGHATIPRNPEELAGRGPRNSEELGGRGPRNSEEPGGRGSRNPEEPVVRGPRNSEEPSFRGRRNSEEPAGRRESWDPEELAGWWDVQPSWQNSMASIARASDPHVVLGDEHGYAVVFPSNGDVAQLAVRRESRRQGHGTRLLHAAAAVAGKPLRIMNVHERDAGIAAFLEHSGAQRTVRQLEMVRALD